MYNKLKKKKNLKLNNKIITYIKYKLNKIKTIKTT